jgi:hypothetical protein
MKGSEIDTEKIGINEGKPERVLVKTSQLEEAMDA